MNEASAFLEVFAMGMKKELFQITEAARACGLSRSTLLRMEEKGLLTPAYIAPDSGRRYYDNHNVARIMQIEKFKSMGISNEQIINYFVRGGEATDILATLAERLHDFQRSVEELRLRVREKAGMSVQVITLPAVTCIMRRYWGHTSQEKYNAMYALYHECIRKGYILSDDPLFTISDRKDFLEGYIGKDPFPFDVCVPLRADKAPAEAVMLPECRALSVLYYGEYGGMDEAWLTLGREVSDKPRSAADFIYLSKAGLVKYTFFWSIFSRARRSPSPNLWKWTTSRARRNLITSFTSGSSESRRMLS